MGIVAGAGAESGLENIQECSRRLAVAGGPDEGGEHRAGHVGGYYLWAGPAWGWGASHQGRNGPR